MTRSFGRVKRKLAGPRPPALATGRGNVMRISLAPTPNGKMGVVLEVGGFENEAEARDWADRLRGVLEKEAGAVDAKP